MVGVRIDRADFVETCRKAANDRCREDAVLGRFIQALEEGECRGVRHRRRVEGYEILHHDVRMGDDETLGIELLWSTVEVGVGVDEVTRVEIPHGQCDGEVLVRFDDAPILRECELGRRHGGLRGYLTHGH